MYTQCSKCETVFKLSADVLRAASGQVRCGRCGEVFNALARLAEDASAFESGESPLELETRADSILESVLAPQVAQKIAEDQEDFAPPGVEIARLQVIDWTDEDEGEPQEEQERRDTDPRDLHAQRSGPRKPAPEAPAEPSLEFTLPPGELDRIFIESKLRMPPLPLPPEALGAPPHPESGVAPSDPAAPSAAVAPSTRVAPSAPRGRVSGLEVPEDVRRQMLESFEPDQQPEILMENSLRRTARPRGFMAWLGAAIVAALLLMAQVVHQNREWLVAHTHGPFGAAVRALYGAMGTPLSVPASLSAYQLRQWGVTGDPEANGKLRLRASILNSAAQLQPFPLLRVTLADRFGKSIGARDFEPSEYLGKPTARLLTPGERADAVLEILDPGKSAEGFEIDVCLRGADQRIACANDVAAQAKR
ncbi:MAG TPA: zinc-ribbon and DUF3426 domain-containing protein [Steroidobacteraceae bacterium]|nr:zinc-ribbon and DUF3426 domain-containing protein [Steroidobacteraceae bacterium]